MSDFGKLDEPRFTALIGDIIDSRHVDDRAGLQRRLRKAIESLNRRFRSQLASALELQRGDEIQCLADEPEVVVDIAAGLSDAIFPERISFGLGYGPLTTDLNVDVGDIDGLCFHQARAGLEAAGGELWLVARGFGEVEDATLTALFGLMGAVRNRWTEKQMAYGRATRDKAQKEVANDFGVSPSTVSESLKASSFSLIRRGEEASKQMLRQFGTKGEFGQDSAKKTK